MSHDQAGKGSGADLSASGPVRERPWPEKLPAYVVSPGDDPRIFGYSALGDLAQAHSFSDGLFLSLTGELPSPAASRAFAITLWAASALTVADAPAHAGVLGRLSGATPAANVALVATAAAERAQYLCERHAGWLAGIRNGERTPCTQTAIDPSDAVFARRIARTLGSAGLALEWLGEGPTADTVILAALTLLGLGTDESLVTVLTAACLTTSLAEAWAWKPGQFQDYPMDLPPFRYQP